MVNASYSRPRKRLRRWMYGFLSVRIGINTLAIEILRSAKIYVRLFNYTFQLKLSTGRLLNLFGHSY